MRIAVISRDRRLYSTRRILSEIKNEGMTPVFLDTLHLSPYITDEKLEIRYRGRSIELPDVVLGRIGVSITEYGLAIVRQFELMGIPIVNSSESISMSRDKFRCTQILKSKAISVPSTTLIRKFEDGDDFIDEIGFPVIIKMHQGAQGIGVMMIDDVKSLRTALRSFWDMNYDVQIQKVIKESLGHDIRAFVIGDRVIAAMRRTSPYGDFRANIHRGGEGTSVEITNEIEEIAIKSAEILGLKIAGIDMLESFKGPLVIEANSSPGFEGLERVSGKNIAKEIVKFLVEYARR